MTPTSLIIVTDRGSLKAYKVNETNTRGASLSLVQAFDTTEAHGRYQDKVTDQAGRFPAGTGGAGGADRHQGATAERQGIETEKERRIIKQLADSIAEVVKREGNDGWSFAAPAAIHAAIVELLPKAGSRLHRRTREIGSGQDRAGRSAATFPLLATRLKDERPERTSLN